MAWSQKARGAYEKGLKAIELVSTAGQKKGEEQTKSIEQAFKYYQEAWIELMEAFNEGLKENSEVQFKEYNKFFEEMQKNVAETFKKYTEAWKL